MPCCCLLALRWRTLPRTSPTTSLLVGPVMHELKLTNHFTILSFNYPLW